MNNRGVKKKKVGVTRNSVRLDLSSRYTLPSTTVCLEEFSGSNGWRLSFCELPNPTSANLFHLAFPNVRLDRC